MELYNWKARRAGGRITITGKTKLGQTDKIVGVDYIEPMTNTCCRAVDKDHVEHRLHLTLA